MKKAGIPPLLLVMAVFTAFLLGFFLGRLNHSESPTLSVNMNAPITSTQADKDLNFNAYVNGKLNINAAEAEDLMLLPGIGETLAQRIIEYRTENGPFASVEDLVNVKGIGASSLEEISAYITVGG